MAVAIIKIRMIVCHPDFERLDAEREEVSDDELVNASAAEEGDLFCWKDWGCIASWRLSPYDEDEKTHNVWCITAWHCFTATLHTDTETENAACWKNLGCVALYHH